MKFDDPAIIAYVDGELDPPAVQAMEAAAAKDPTLARRIAAHRAVKAGLAAAFAPVLEEPPPARFAELIAGHQPPAAEVVDLGAVRKARARPNFPLTETWRRLRQTPTQSWSGVAAVLVVGVVAAGFFWPRTAPLLVERSGGLAAGPELAAALDNQLANPNARDLAVRTGLSFKSRDGAYCRTFQAKADGGVAGLACHAPGGWRVRMALAHPEGPSPEYRMAGGDAPAALISLVGELIEGQPLDRAGEAAAARRGWISAPAAPAAGPGSSGRP